MKDRHYQRLVLHREGDLIGLSSQFHSLKCCFSPTRHMNKSREEGCCWNYTDHNCTTRENIYAFIIRRQLSKMCTLIALWAKCVKIIYLVLYYLVAHSFSTLSVVFSRITFKHLLRVYWYTCDVLPWNTRRWIVTTSCLARCHNMPWV